MPSTQPEVLTIDRLTTPIGIALLVSDEGGVLRAFNWTDYEDAVQAWLARRYPAAARREAPSPQPLRSAFEAYFAGDLAALADVRWAASGTDFQLRIWDLLCEIPVGETITYGELARRAGRPTASRAAGAANGRNPLGVIVPCHRVIGTGGALTGYAGGLARKEWLLNHERRARRTSQAA